ncbi:MAG: FAD-dependent oxidoreductase [Candidatus Obscuribacterales bacterium]|nr:FAD-dependent oxidoreductase [Candidatus Obscuribacterales bacterium]
MKRVAIVGSGIAGLGCAHLLHDEYEIVLFEKNNYVGGHTNTIDVPENGETIPIDTGFMVFNHETYPNLTKLFQELGVETKPTDMSISVQSIAHDIEWCGSSLNQVFGQRKNILSARFWRLMLDLNRFNSQAENDVDNRAVQAMTVAEYVKFRSFGEDLLNLYLVPMASAIWSMPPSATKSFPVSTLLRFFHNHRFNAGLDGHLKWYTVVNGAREYVKKLVVPFSDRIRLNSPVKRIIRNSGSVSVLTAAGEERFDHVILASHADESLKMLDSPTDLEATLLQNFSYQLNDATVHTDTTVMPRTKRCWAAWNYRFGKTIDEDAPPTTHYWMNRLQGVSQNRDYFVSLNSDAIIDPSKIIKQIKYTHPTYTRDSIAAQARLHELNLQGSRQVLFCGSYFRYGFHEDAFTSALNLCRLMKREVVPLC